MAVTISLSDGRQVSLADGKTLLEAARDMPAAHGVSLEAPCGGSGSCGQCRVQVITGDVSPPTASEQEALSAEEFARGYRLACQCIPLTDSRFHIPPGSRTASAELQVIGDFMDVQPDPTVAFFRIHVRPATLDYPVSCCRQVEEALQTEHRIPAPATDIDCIRNSSPPDGAGYVTAVVRGQRVIDIRHGESSTALLGLAVDLGTTKIAAYLVDLQSGRTLASEGAMNPQLRFGADVISRIAYAERDRAAAKKLAAVVRECINNLALIVCGRLGRDSREIVDSLVVANTAMHHLLLDLPVHQLGRSPFIPATTRPLRIRGNDIDLKFAPGATVYCMPPVAGFVGGDLVAMAMACGFDKFAGTALGLDIGTNTELILAHEGELFSTSCASGPAFEGANIRNGVRAVSGAVWRVQSDEHGKVVCHTVNEQPAIGLCGSGVIDAVAALLKVGVLNRMGLLDRNHPLVRLRPENGEAEFLLIEESTEDLENGLALGQKDIGAVQLAKAAIASGITGLLEKAGVAVRDLEKIVIAGAFGSRLDPSSCVRLGMLPEIPLERIEQVGNAAGAGARMALVSAAERRGAEALAKRIQYLEIASDPSFSVVFSRALFFPEPDVSQVPDS